MLTEQEQRKVHDLYKQTPIPWNKILYVYENAFYHCAFNFKTHVEKLKYAKDKRRCYVLMNKIDLQLKYNEDIHPTIRQLCDILKIDKYEYKYPEDEHTFNAILII